MSSGRKASELVSRDRLHSVIITIARVPLIIMVAHTSQGRDISHASSRDSTDRSSETLPMSRGATSQGSRVVTSQGSREDIRTGSRVGTSQGSRVDTSPGSREHNTTHSTATATQDSISHIRDRTEKLTRNDSTQLTTILMLSIA